MALHTAQSIKQSQCSSNIPGTGKWVPARPINDDSIWTRFKLAFFVLTGRYDAVDWEN